MTRDEETHSLVRLLADKHGGRILAALKDNPQGLTDFELADALGIYLSSVNAARNRLMNQGLVREGDERRPSGRGGVARVWHYSPPPNPQETPC